MAPIDPADTSYGRPDKIRGRKMSLSDSVKNRSTFEYAFDLDFCEWQLTDSSQVPRKPPKKAEKRSDNLVFHP